MLKARFGFTFIFGYVFALAACADSATESSITAPDVAPSLDVPDLEVADPGVGTQQAETGGRASGHADVSRRSTISTASDRYSFIAIATEPSPTTPFAFAAKGEFQGHQEVVSTSGPSVTRTIHADVDCIRIIGNIAILSGPVERLVVNGQEQVMPGLQVIVQVQDNGEGHNSPPDAASSIIFMSIPQACQEFSLGMVLDEKNNIQVRATR